MKNSDINKLYENFKEKVAISNFEVEYDNSTNNQKNFINKGSVIVASCIGVVLLSGIVYSTRIWNIEFKDSENTIESPNNAITTARETGYADEFEDDYFVKDGVGIKIDSFLVTDDCLNATINFKFAKEKEVDSDSFRFGFIIYDENKNLYQVSPRMSFGKTISEHDAVVSLLDEMGIEYDENNIFQSTLSDSATIEEIETNKQERTILKDITIRATNQYPKSKKIYIKFFDLGYCMMDLNGLSEPIKDFSQIEMEDFKVTDEEWIFELDVSEKMAERETLELELKDEIPGIEIEKCTLTESGMVIIFKSDEYIEYVCKGKEMKENISDASIKIFNVTNEDGKCYMDLGSGLLENGSYKVTVDISKQDFEKGLFIDYESNGKEYRSELVEITK